MLELADGHENLRLGSLLDGLVESLGRRVSVLPEDLVLSQEHSLDSSHQDSSFTVKVGVDPASRHEILISSLFRIDSLTYRPVMALTPSRRWSRNSI
jgi:hypothetical protein